MFIIATSNDYIDFLEYQLAEATKNAGHFNDLATHVLSQLSLHNPFYKQSDIDWFLSAALKQATIANELQERLDELSFLIRPFSL